MNNTSNGTLKHTDAKSVRRTRPADDSLSNYVFGKVQPQAIPLEEAVLGALMLDRDVFDIVSDFIQPETFYVESHQLIYRSIQTLHNNNRPVDLLTVTEQMRKDGTIDSVGGGYYLVELSHRVASAANTEYHSRIIQQKWIARTMIDICTKSIREFYEETSDVLESFDRHESLISKVRIWESKQVQNLSQLGAAVLRDLENRANTPGGLIGVPTGIRDIDAKTGGWQKTDLIIIAARPGMGKSGFIVSTALNAARDFKKPVALFSLEMQDEQMMKRIIAIDAQVNSEKFRSGQGLSDDEWQRIGQSIERLSNVPIYIDDTPGIDLYELKSKARRMKKQYGIELLIIDYLQLITLSGDAARGKNREQEVAAISKSLKNLAKELQIPVIALAQLSRAVENRGGSKRPQLSDLRESGSVEQDSDIVSFLYRPEYYQIMEDEHGNSTRGLCEFILAKHRHGKLEPVRIGFIDELVQFCDFDELYFRNIAPATRTMNNDNVVIFSESNRQEPGENDLDPQF